jgi:hypothetical protein
MRGTQIRRVLEIIAEIESVHVHASSYNNILRPIQLNLKVKR